MRTDDRHLPGADRKPSPGLNRLQAVLDDLRLIHRAETCRIGGREVDVCSTCRVEPADTPRGVDLAAATSGRELYPCPTLRVARRHARMVEVGR